MRETTSRRDAIRRRAFSSGKPGARALRSIKISYELKNPRRRERAHRSVAIRWIRARLHASPRVSAKCERLRFGITASRADKTNFRLQVPPIPRDTHVYRALPIHHQRVHRITILDIHIGSAIISRAMSKRTKNIKQTLNALPELVSNSSLYISAIASNIAPREFISQSYSPTEDANSAFTCRSCTCVQDCRG